MGRRKGKGIEISHWKVGEADAFEALPSEEPDEACLTSQEGREVRKYEPLQKPDYPGFYWLAEAGEEPHIVEVCVESDSHDMFYILLPDDNRKYLPEMWSGALWFGPLDEEDVIMYTGRK